MGSWDVPPPTSRLDALPPDEWALLLIQARAVLQELPDDPEHPARGQLRDLPTGRLAGGKARDRLVGLLATDTALWRAVVGKLEAHADGSVVFDALAAAGDGTARGAAAAATDPRATAPAPRTSAPEPDRATAQALEDARRRAARDRERLGSVRQERDDARRRAETAERQVETTEQELTATRARMRQLETEVAELRKALEVADRDRERAVERERRRRVSELTVLEEEVAALRRKDEERRARDRRGADRERRRNEELSRPRPAETAPRPPRLVPGRPSRLPAGIVPGTREAAELFLHRGRRVLVDGYNVTLQHQANLGLEQQRTWLVTALANLARARGVVPTVVFDGERSGGQRGGPSVREVTVRFSAPGVTADDEIVLDVEATDDPVVVVTDDRELLDRVRRSGADTIGSKQLIWVL
jgi:hypothetical protein